MENASFLGKFTRDAIAQPVGERLFGGEMLLFREQKSESVGS